MEPRRKKCIAAVIDTSAFVYVNEALVVRHGTSTRTSFAIVLFKA